MKRAPRATYQYLTRATGNLSTIEAALLPRCEAVRIANVLRSDRPALISTELEPLDVDPLCQNSRSAKMKASKAMQRVDLYIKVEVELDEDETADRVAREICRQIEKMHVVRAAELSNSITRD